MRDTLMSRSRVWWLQTEHAHPIAFNLAAALPPAAVFALFGLWVAAVTWLIAWPVVRALGWQRGKWLDRNFHQEFGHEIAGRCRGSAPRPPR